MTARRKMKLRLCVKIEEATEWKLVRVVDGRGRAKDEGKKMVGFFKKLEEEGYELFWRS
jgi:hypothetical protein